MKRRSHNSYPDILSFSDFKIEKDRLELKLRLLELRIEMHVSHLRNKLSLAELVTSFLNDMGLARIAETVSSLLSNRFTKPD